MFIVDVKQQYNNDKLYRGIKNGPSPVCSYLYLFSFLSLQIFRRRYLHNRLSKKLQIWYRGSQRQVVLWDCKWAFSYLFYLVFVPFSFSPDFSSEISPQLFKIETSNLVYMFTKTSYNVGLKMGILLFVLPCIFLSLYIFRLRYQPYALEALKQGLVRFSDSSSSPGQGNVKEFGDW